MSKYRDKTSWHRQYCNYKYVDRTTYGEWYSDLLQAGKVNPFTTETNPTTTLNYKRYSSTCTRDHEELCFLLKPLFIHVPEGQGWGSLGKDPWAHDGRSARGPTACVVGPKAFFATRVVLNLLWFEKHNLRPPAVEELIVHDICFFVCHSILLDVVKCERRNTEPFSALLSCLLCFESWWMDDRAEGTLCYVCPLAPLVK